MKVRFLLALAAAALGAASHAQIFGAASDYNVFVFGGYTSQWSDTQGRMAIGGNASLTGYDVGITTPGSDVLVVGGDLNYSQGTIRGNAVVGGSSSLSNVSFTDGGSLGSGTPVNFGQAQSDLLALSAIWKDVAPTGTVAKPYSSLELTGSNAGLNVFNVSLSDLNSASDVKISVPAGASVLVNLTGTGGSSLPNFGYSLNGSQDKSAFSNVVWNVTDATSLSLNSLNGTLFAPKTDITGSWGALNGQLIANSFDGPTQMNYNPYAGTAPVPEPVSMTILGAGAVAWLLKRRVRTA